MRVYLDTGVFVDYLSYPGYLGSVLRKKGRRNRNVQQLQQDVTDCLNRIRRKHEGFTSCLAMYEAEEALFAKITKISKGVPNGKKFAIPSSRTLNIQVLMVKQHFNLKILDLTEDIFQKELQNISLQIKGVRAGDSLHITTAILNNADMMITTDKHLMALDRTLSNSKSTPIRCLDTNDAKQIL